MIHSDVLHIQNIVVGDNRHNNILAFKAEKAGLLIVKVNPKATTIDCSSCGQAIPKTLKDRWYCCCYCGLLLLRDWNAAINIKHRIDTIN